MALLEGGAPFCAVADQNTADNALANNDILKFAGQKFIVRFIG